MTNKTTDAEKHTADLISSLLSKPLELTNYFYKNPSTMEIFEIFFHTVKTTKKYMEKYDTFPETPKPE